MSSNGGPLLEVKGISKYFGSVIALKDVSMFVRALGRTWRRLSAR